jgi:hypothetical protein
VHQRPDIISDGELIAEGIYLSGSFKQAVEAINNRVITSADIKKILAIVDGTAENWKQKLKKEAGLWKKECRKKYL